MPLRYGGGILFKYILIPIIIVILSDNLRTDILYDMVAIEMIYISKIISNKKSTIRYQKHFLNRIKVISFSFLVWGIENRKF